MLGWWSGRTVERCDHGDSTVEPPETPAPLFAVRALKSALFGAPEILDEETLHQMDNEREKKVNDKYTTKIKDTSPQKSGGILITPGTAATRRKTVSFGNGVLDNEGNRPSAKSRRASNSWKNASPFDSESRGLGHKTTLTLKLEDSRQKSVTSNDCAEDNDTSNIKSESKHEVNVSTAKKTNAQGSSRLTHSQISNQDMHDLLEHHEDLADMTLDLNEPHSQSGKYWKGEFENYHEEAKSQMKRLVRYRQLAKSYAQKKDEESLQLGEKLKEEQQKVANMEENVAKLTARIATQNHRNGENEVSELMRELAKQAALATQYRAEVEKFRTALGGTFCKGEHKQTMPEQLDRKSDEGYLLRRELANVRRTLSNVEREAEKLRGVNEKLAQELRQANTRHDRHLEKCEQRKRSSEEERQELQRRHSDMKEVAKSRSRDADILLKRRHDQIVALKQEILSSREATTSAQDSRAPLQQDLKYVPLTGHHHIVHGTENIRPLTGAGSRALSSKLDEHHDEVKGGNHVVTRVHNDENCQRWHNASHENTCRTEHAVTTDARPAHPRLSSEVPPEYLKSHASRAVLSEITNSSGQETKEIQFPYQHPDGFPSPKIDQSLPDSLLPAPHARQENRERRYHVSPQSIVIKSSPPKLQTMPPTFDQISTVEDLPRPRRKKGDSRPSSLTMGGSHLRKGPLPPDRAAAAKVRLEQKLADKKKASVNRG